VAPELLLPPTVWARLAGSVTELEAAAQYSTRDETLVVAVMRAGAKREDTRIVRTLSEATYLEPKFGP
jgi:hypothetical protein